MADLIEKPSLQEALCKAALEAGAIPKDDVNEQQRFKYRGIDRIMAALGPAMSRNGIVPMPKIMAVDRETMARGSNNAMWRLVTLTVEYEFTGPAGDKLTAIVMGEGLDNADKATSKAFTMAQKTCYLQVFKIGDGSTDPDGTTPPEQTEPTSYRPAARPRSTPIAASEVDEMKPARVTKALHEAGLDTSGTADEQRARLIAHLSAPAEEGAG